MINREELLDYMRREAYRPLAYKDLQRNLGISADDEHKFAKLIGRLEKEGEILKTRKDKYGIPELMNLYRGTIRLSQRGHGILIADDNAIADIFVYGKNIKGAMHGDKVIVRLYKKADNGERPEGEVVKIIQRNTLQLVGRFERGKFVSQVIPDDGRQIYPIYVKVPKKLKINNGDKVLVEITAWPDKNTIAEGKITEIFGAKGEPDLDYKVVIKKHGLRDTYPQEVIDEAKQAVQPISDQEIARRKDLRKIRMITIDGEDAKDLDDAISIEKIDAVYRLGVHIADVSYYVQEDTKLDKEAYARATSVYLVDKVLAMLPHELSNGICSLNAGEDRLAMSCIMDIDTNGGVLNYEIVESVIHINRRMSYKQVNQILTGDDAELKNEFQEFLGDLALMPELAQILRNKRMQRGMLDFDFPEAKVIVDDDGRVIEVKKIERGVGEKLIEDFMIQANEVVAEHLFRREIPVLYRVHEKPDTEAINKLNRILGIFGHKLEESKVNSKLFQSILKDIKGEPGEMPMALTMLRSMKHARYVPQPLGHFGLASKYYCHFTSPIRRYPDLTVHRILKESNKGKIGEKRIGQLFQKLTTAGDHCTSQEMKAEEAERDLLDIKKAEYMAQFIGEEFTAKISSVLAFGFFVELENTVEGLVHVSSISDDYYDYNDRTLTLVGSHSGRKFSIGDMVRVLLLKVNTDDAKIDFELVNN